MVKYEDLTQYQKEIICNGCGGKGSMIRPPHGAFFEASCNHHDYGYWKGCTEKHRKVCDSVFYKLMLNDCDRLPWYKRVLYKAWAWAYYISVRAVGWKYFYYGDAQRDASEVIPKECNNE